MTRHVMEESFPLRNSVPCKYMFPYWWMSKGKLDTFNRHLEFSRIIFILFSLDQQIWYHNSFFDTACLHPLIVEVGTALMTPSLLSGLTRVHHDVFLVYIITSVNINYSEQNKIIVIFIFCWTFMSLMFMSSFLFGQVIRTALSNRLAKVQGFLFRAAFLRRVPTFVRLIIENILLCFLHSTLFSTSKYLTGALGLRFRKILTELIHDDYFEVSFSFFSLWHIRAFQMYLFFILHYCLYLKLLVICST